MTRIEWLRTRNWLDRSWFTDDDCGGDVGFAYLFGSAIAFIPLLVFVLCMTAGPFYLTELWWFAMAGVPLFPAFMRHVVPKFSLLNGIPDSHLDYYSRNSYNLRERAKEYYSLPMDDRSNYPANIMSIIRDTSLSRQQKFDVDDAMRNVYSEIKTRDEARDALTARSVDISDVLETMTRNAEHLREIETKTYMDASVSSRS